MITTLHVKRILFGMIFMSEIVVASANSFVIGKNRFTFLTETLVRLEYATDGQFVDEPTLFAAERNDKFSGGQMKNLGNNHYQLTTQKMRIEFADDGYPFGQTNIAVYFRSDSTRKERRWKVSDEQSSNLLGAITTLDGIDDSVPRQEGLLSRDGWYVIRDTGKELLRNGWFAPRSRNHVQDIYLFAYDNDYRAALRSLQTVSGAVPMTRKYVHGSWYCRWWNYTGDEYRQLVDEYRQHDFPLDIVVFDMGWHKQKFAEGTGHAGMKGWTGYSWNRDLIKDPASLIRDFKKDNIYVVLNEHPHDGIRPEEDSYPQFMHDLGLDPKKDATPIFDAGNHKYMDAFLKNAHGPSDSMGVAFWWLDWQQDYIYPTVRGTTMKHLPWVNELFYNYSKHSGLRGAGFSRWAGWGDQRHPIQFSGDAGGNWNLLRFEIDLTTTSGNAGCFFWAHDTGGFYDGRDPELYTRWTQFSMLSSSLRIHSVYDAKLDRRPWLWGGKAEEVMRHCYHLRAQLMPYIYTSVWQCHKDMIPLNRGLYLDDSANEESYRHPSEFLFGDLILGAPVTKAGEGEQKLVRQDVWLPKGTSWYHFFSGERYEGGQTVTVESTLDNFPLFVKGGYPLPMQPYTQRMATTPLTTLIVRCYPGESGCNNTYTLYEDDGLTMDYSHGKYATTDMNYKNRGKQILLTLSAVKGSYEGQPRQRSYVIELPGVKSQSAIRVNGTKVRSTYDASFKGCRVTTKSIDIRKPVTIQINM